MFTANYLLSVYGTEKEIVINCGARSCLGCGKCYKKCKKNNAIVYINEILKADVTKYIKGVCALEEKGTVSYYAG